METTLANIGSLTIGEILKIAFFSYIGYVIAALLVGVIGMMFFYHFVFKK